MIIDWTYGAFDKQPSYFGLVSAPNYNATIVEISITRQNFVGWGRDDSNLIGQGRNDATIIGQGRDDSTLIGRGMA